MPRIATIALALTATAALALAGQTVASGASTAEKRGKLVRFESCKAFNAYAKKHALRRVEASGLALAPVGATVGATDGARDVPAEESAATADAAGVPGQDFSTTNIQEEGVDEPDIVKTDGRHLYTVVGNKLHMIDARAALPRLVGSVDLPPAWEHELFLYDARAIVLSRTDTIFPEPLPADLMRYSFVGNTTVTSINVRRPAAPQVVESYAVEGNYLAARLSGASLRVVTTAPSPLGLEFVFPTEGLEEADALRANRREIRSSRARDWVPRFLHTNHKTEKSTQGRAVPCRRIRRPATFAGLGTVTIYTFDLGRSLRPIDHDSVMTSGDTVYASQKNVYVATQRWLDPTTVDSPDDFARVGTLIHRFSTVGPRSTVYRGAGRVPGFILNQFALSEHEGHLRVATTQVPTWWNDPESESESFVSTLRLEKGALPLAGRVGGLGRGERVFAVRFVGEMGYVVTFRQVDPLYTIDLADPADPKVRGELKILGFSAYLHPISSTQLIGVGQDATEEGRLLGTQVALFDVSDPAKPERVDSKTIIGGFSGAEWDHRAFLWWAPKSLAILPVQAFEYSGDVLSNWFVGAAGFTVDGGVEEAGRVTHPTPGPKSEPQPWLAAVRRAVVVGNRLFTVGDNGVGVSDLSTLARTGWVPLPVAAGDDAIAGPPVELAG